jgi:DNA polymerase elongation subunit (family B)
VSVLEELAALDAARKTTFDKSVKAQVKILTIDVERAPGSFLSWDPFPKFLGPEKMLQPSRIICFAAKWFGEKEVIFYDERDGHRQMIEAAWRLLTEADVVVTYNGDKADVPWFNEHFADYGLGPAAPFKSVDLIKSNRQRFNLPYRRLDYLASRYIGASKDHTDFQLWLDCMAGDEKQWARMRRYNENDVRLTEKVYLRLLPWITNSPHFGMLTGQSRACPFCGSPKLVRTGKTVAAFVQKYSLLRCQACLGWSREVFKMQDPNFTRAVR